MIHKIFFFSHLIGSDHINPIKNTQAIPAGWGRQGMFLFGQTRLGSRTSHISHTKCEAEAATAIHYYKTESVLSTSLSACTKSSLPVCCNPSEHPFISSWSAFCSIVIPVCLVQWVYFTCYEITHSTCYGITHSTVPITVMIVKLSVML